MSTKIKVAILAGEYWRAGSIRQKRGSSINIFMVKNMMRAS